MTHTNKKLYMVSLGCDKNLVDSEEMLAILADHGYIITDDETEADCAVINTCCFIEDAKKETPPISLRTNSIRMSRSGRCSARRS